MKSNPVHLAALTSCLVFSVACGTVHADDCHHHHPMPQQDAPVPQFIASTAKPFGQLMDDAMAVMQKDMVDAPMTGVPAHDFVTMMIPHHQGAINMAKALLLTNPEPGLRNLALGIIAEQQIEIQQMTLWLAQHPAR